MKGHKETNYLSQLVKVLGDSVNTNQVPEPTGKLLNAYKLSFKLASLNGVPLLFNVGSELE